MLRNSLFVISCVFFNGAVMRFEIGYFLLVFYWLLDYKKEMLNIQLFKSLMLWNFATQRGEENAQLSSSCYCFPFYASEYIIVQKHHNVTWKMSSLTGGIHARLNERRRPRSSRHRHTDMMLISTKEGGVEYKSGLHLVNWNNTCFSSFACNKKGKKKNYSHPSKYLTK